MRESLGWVVAGVTAGAGLILALWYLLRGQPKRASTAALEAATDWHAQAVRAKKAKVEELLKDFDRNEKEIKRITDKLDQKKERLMVQYIDKGLTDDEIAARFSRIGL